MRYLVTLCISIALSLFSASAFANATCNLPTLTPSTLFVNYTPGAAASPNGINMQVQCRYTSGSTTQSYIAKLPTYIAYIPSTTYALTLTAYWNTVCSGAQDYPGTTGGTMVISSTTFSTVFNRNFAICVDGGQFPGVAGDYNVIQGAAFGSPVGAPANQTIVTVQQGVNMTIHVEATCITTGPNNISMTYPSNSASDVVQTTSFTARCNTPYSMSLSPASGTLKSVPYSLILATTAGSTTDISGQLITPAAAQTSSAVTYYVRATAPAGSAGDCTVSCVGSTVHTLTITY